MEEIIGVSVPIWGYVKAAVLFGILVYIVFAFVLVRQVNLMTDTLELGHENFIKALSKVHFIISIVLFVFALLIL